MSIRVPLAVASDQSQSRAFSEQRLVNLFAENSPLGGKSPFMLIGTPGLKAFSTCGAGPFRGAVKMQGIAYFVSGPSLYRLGADGSATLLGPIDGTGFVSMATAGTQVAIAASSQKGYVYTLATNTLAQVTDADFYGGNSVTALDGYFIWGSNSGFINRFQWSALLDGMTYDALDIASVESSSTELIRAFLVGTQIFHFKSDRIEVWYDAGDVDSPFQRLNSAIIPKGLACKFSPALADNSVFWVGLDDNSGGSPAVYRATGYTPQLVSTHPVARALSQVTDLSQVMGMSYIKDNHEFYGIILPSGNSWFYDIPAGLWHERTTYGLNRWLGSVHLEAYGKSLVGSSQDGTVYYLDLDTYFDAGTIPIISEATLPAFGDDADYRRMSKLRLDMETGVGLNTGQGIDPKIILNISDDRGQTWSSDITHSMGAMGNYGKTVEWRGLGQFRSRILKFRISDPVKRVFLALWADISK